MYKIIVFRYPNQATGGRPIIDDRNIAALRQVSNKIKSYELTRLGVYSKKANRYLDFIRICFGIKISTKEIEQLLGKIDESTLIFASHSTYGFLLKKIKQYNPKIQTITFFHNIERAFIWEQFKIHPCFAKLKNYLLISLMEKLTVKYSDKIIVLNQRDQQLLKQIYHIPHSYIWPTALKDRFQPKLKKQFSKRLNLLFVGTLFYANEQAILWMLQNIVPFIDADFQIVGSGMDKFCSYTKKFNNVHFTGEVDCHTLDSFYYSADLFISTLFLGGGMKTKVAEAIMFGLPVIGTKETFRGYEEHVSQIGICSETPDEIICAINKFIQYPDLLHQFSHSARQTFIEYYSYESSLKRIREII